MQAKLPPGPRMPSVVQTLGWWARPIAFMERCRATYGKRYTIKLVGSPPFVNLSTPDEIKEVFKAPPDHLHPGEGARILEPVVGTYSLILLDEDSHLEQRKLLSPAFHGKKMQELNGLITEVAEAEVDKWPRNDAVALHPKLQALTLEIILRAVFGLDEGERLDKLRSTLTTILEFGARPESLVPFLQRDLGRFTAFGRFVELRAQADELIYDLIDERRAGDGEERGDIMAMLLAARHEDGSPMEPKEIRDELMTLLVAGHETTASELGWAFERLVREPRVLERLQQEIDRQDGDDYLTATVQETLRRRPVLPNAEPRLTKREVEIGGWLYPEGVSLICNSYLLHHDPDVYEDPYAFRPERFLDEPPGTYTWIPFGGGRRRCIGAAFATLEMKIVLRAVLERTEIRAGTNGHELTRRRSITISPRLGAPTVLRDRDRAPVVEPVAA
jgi:cytochrome P450